MVKRKSIFIGFILTSIISFIINTVVLGLGVAKNSTANSASSSSNQKISKEAEIVPNKIVIKFKNRSIYENFLSSAGEASIIKLLKTHGIANLKPVIKERHRLSKTSSFVAVENIYYANVENGESPLTVARALSKNPLIEYAEPLYIHYFFDTPNDALFSQQPYLNVIQVEQAWDVVKGEQGNVVVAVVDGGTDIDHPDLAANLWVNPGEIANNSIDDDGNGFIDDVHGWNFANNRNDPTGLPTTPGNANHGTQTAGIACAVSNNGNGISGTSWNAKVMAINVSDPNFELFRFPFDGVIYAARNGADVINMSWGREMGGPSRFEQDIINFAFEMGAVLVAAAGNSNSSGPGYPASYPNVLSVAATNNFDQKASFSNFGLTVDIAAPGIAILSTINNGQFSNISPGISSGTSFSTPIVAGVAALVKTQHPDWLPIQVSEQVRLTADNIDAINTNFIGLLGRGRVNAFKAVSETNFPAIRISNIDINDTNDNDVIQYGETIEVLISLTNYLAQASNVNLNLTTNDPYVDLTNANASISSLGTLEETATPVSFTFQVASIAPTGRVLNFNLGISTGEFQDSDQFTLVIEPSFETVNINNVDVSLTSIGRIGFAEPFNQRGGIGFKFNDSPSLLFEGAIIAGTAPDRISNAARGIRPNPPFPNILDQDFAASKEGDIQINTPGKLTDQETFAIFEDTKSNTPMNLRITQKSFAATEPPNDDFVILKYNVENQGTNTLENFHFGLFFDWDIIAQNDSEVFQNFASFDVTRKTGFVSLFSTFVGVSLLSDGGLSYKAINNNTINDADGFTDQEKWQAISGGIQTTQVGPADVSNLIASGPFSIGPNDQIEIVFALLAGTGLQDLQSNADAAKELWEHLLTTDIADKSTPGIPTDFSLEQNYPNPFNPNTTIQYQIPELTKVKLVIYNALGQKIRTLLNKNQESGQYNVEWDGKDDKGLSVPSGIYIYQINSGLFSQSRKLLLLR